MQWGVRTINSYVGKLQVRIAVAQNSNNVRAVSRCGFKSDRKGCINIVGDRRSGEKNMSRLCSRNMSAQQINMILLVRKEIG